jgi:predicted RNA methylase
MQTKYSHKPLLPHSTLINMQNNNTINTDDPNNQNCLISSNIHCRYKQKLRKKTGNNCYTLNLLKSIGNIHLISKEEKLCCCKLRIVEFDDHFDELLEKGKSDDTTIITANNSISFPELGFWHQRYYYYSKYDEGIQMDDECWWSVTPEIISEYIAKLAGNNAIVIDGFCGSGGNVIQFSKFCSKIYAIDIDKTRLDICKHNCEVYKCKDNVVFILSDFLLMENNPIFTNKADYIFLSPPWGGVKYKNSDVYSIKNLMTPSIYDIIRVSLNVSKRIMFYLPRTLLLEELFEILSEILNKTQSGSGDRIFFDVHILKSANKIKAQLIIFGNDITTCIKEDDLNEYLQYKYDNISEQDIKVFKVIAKLLGLFKFIQYEKFIRKMILEDDDNGISDLPGMVIKYFFSKILTEREKIKLKSLNVYNPKQRTKNGSNNISQGIIKHKERSINTSIYHGDIELDTSYFKKYDKDKEHLSTNNSTITYKTEENEKDNNNNHYNNNNAHNNSNSSNSSSNLNTSNGSPNNSLSTKMKCKSKWELEMSNEIHFQILSI